MINKDNRLNLLYVDEEIVANILFRNSLRSNIFLTTDNLPRDIEVVSIRHDFTKRCFVFEIRHDTFEVVPHGELIPELNVQVIQYHLELTKEQKEKIHG